MITSGLRNIIRLVSILFLFTVLATAAYQAPREPRPAFVVNNQRSADSGYRYAWFTRDLHDQVNSDDGNRAAEQGPSAHRGARLRMLKSLLNRQYLNNNNDDGGLASFNEER